MATKLYGIDVSSNQPENICTRVKHDFCLVKVGGNPHGYKWNYLNPYAKKQLDDAYKKHGRVGCYWFTYGRDDANEEANLFVAQVKKLGYLNKAVLVVDYEADALQKGRNWCKKFCDRVGKLAGYAPVLYASGSVIGSQKLDGLGYPIWCANYTLGSKKLHNYDTTGCKLMYSKAVLWQFTEYGYLDGYASKLDCNVFYGGDADWKALANVKAAPSPQPAEKKKPIAEIAQECIDGKWGAGAVRKSKLTKAGYDYDAVQKKVNEILNAFPLPSGHAYGKSASAKIHDGGKNAADKANVKKIQKAVGAKQDGSFGPATEKAVKAYQKNQKLTQDGLVGSKTWAKMFS